jgi:hypothetical protein
VGSKNDGGILCGILPRAALLLRNDMNTDIDESDCTVIQKGGGEVGKRSAGLAGSPDSANAVIVAGVESFPLHYGTKRYSIRSRSGSNARLHECS